MKTIFEDNLVSLTNTYTAFSDTTTFRNRPILLSQATVLCTWSHAKCLSLLKLGFTHQKGLYYQMFELEDSGLPQQGILPISAKKQKQWPQMFV